MKKIWRFRGKGKCMAAEVVVICKSLTRAEKLVKDWCRDNGLGPMELDGEPEVFNSPMIVHAWDGDY